MRLFALSLALAVSIGLCAHHYHAGVRIVPVVNGLPNYGGGVGGGAPMTINIPTASPIAINGSPVPATASPGSYLVSGAGGTPGWVPTPSPGPTPDLAPTSIAGLPTCVPGILGRKGQVTNQNCGAITYYATPLSTAGQGCQAPVYCAGAPTGTPTPGWVLD